MLRLVAIGVWVILVTAGATFASVYVGRDSDSSAPSEDQGVEMMSGELNSIPVMRGGEVEGYVILQVSIAADRALLAQKKLDPLPYIKDSLFRVVSTSSDIDYRNLKPDDLNRLTDAVAAQANRRLGGELVRQVLLQQINYVKKEDIRTNWMGAGNAAN